MKARREMDEGIRLIRRERGKVHALVRALEESLFGTEQQRAEHEAEVVRERVADRLASYEAGPEKKRSKRGRMYGWNKLMRGR